MADVEAQNSSTLTVNVELSSDVEVNGTLLASDTPPPLLAQAESTNNEEDEVQPCSFAEARAELDSLAEDESKFEKFGRKFVLSLLKGELQKLQQSKNQRVETRLYKYQIEAVLKVKEHFDNVCEEGEMKSALVVAPPGSGKSGMVTLIPYVLESKRVLVLTPSRIISEQLAADFGYRDAQPFLRKSGMFLEDRQLRKLLEGVDLVQTQKDIDCMTASNLVIVNAQKFGGRAANSLSSNTKTPEQISRVQKQLKQFDTIIVDEAHHYPASTWVNIVNVFAGKKVVFLTATPFRGDAHMAQTEGLMNKVETVYEIFRRDLEGVTIRPTEFREKPARSEEVVDPAFLEQLREDIKEILDTHNEKERRATGGHQAMILVKSKSEARDVARGLGEKATFVISEKEGTKNLADFTAGKKEIVVVCGMLREGYDNSKVSLVVILRKCKSRVLFDQFCGRCMRMNRNLTGKGLDRTVGTVLSYIHFRQSEMWAKRLQNAQEDPDPSDEGDDGNELVVNVL